MTPAYKTLDAINTALKADQGASYRTWLGRVISHIGDAYNGDKVAHRSHMGASGLGNECGRAIWYNFRWATNKAHEGRMIRLFNRGHLEEARFIALLLMIGCQVYQQDENGKQFRISFAEGHAGGSGDGVVIGIPDLAEGQACLSEFKTHSDSSFKKLKESGVRATKFEHYVQVNLYMHKMGIPVCLYMAVNKNDDDLYLELIKLDTLLAEQFIERGTKLVWMDEPPEKLNKSPGFFKCKMCDHRPVCHLKQEPDKNCRTCAYSVPVDKGEWKCTNPRVNEPVLPKVRQLTGCEHYEKAGYYQ